MLRKNLLIAFLCLQSLSLLAKDYKASLFGIHSDGVTLNTRSIQFAIDHISAKGGGRLVFYVGRYLTGSLHLKSNVTLHLEEGAVLVGSTNPFDYDKINWTALIFAHNQENIGITGKGVIDGQGKTVAMNVVANIEKNLLVDTYKYGRPSEANRPMIVNFDKCKNIVVRGITLRSSASWNQSFDQCKNLTIDSITVHNTDYWNEDGVDVVDCEDVTITNSFINAADDGICLKSHDATKACKNILISNNTIRSSANAIKFGTMSKGGFSNVRILNNKVYDTYRSALALESVDGGFLENVEVDGLYATNTGNLIFLRTGERVAGKKSSLKNIRIRNVDGQIPAGKPDAGYGYEGPVEDQPRNVSPGIIIVGLPDAIITDVTLSNITLRHAGGGKAEYANVPLDQLSKIPEIPAQYPEFSMFKELPAWAVFVKHASDIKIQNLNMVVDQKDFRVPVVLDNVRNSSFTGLKVKAEGKKPMVYQHNTKNIKL